MDFDPYENDPGRWGASLVTLAELLFPCLDAVGARSVIEIGAYAGDLTRLLAEWGAPDARVMAIDPSPQDELVELAEANERVELVREPSLTALEHVPVPSAVIVDGDHNYYTVTRELELIERRAEGGELPLLILHDVAWPHARRDVYFDPELIPEDERQPIVEGAGLSPGVEGVRHGALPYKYAAAREGGPRNGVLTAAEDFVERRDNLRLAVVPAFFGFGLIWRRDAPWADAIGEIVELWDRNPLIDRLEANRVLHLASGQYYVNRALQLGQKNARQEELLRGLLMSKAFAIAERLSRIRGRGVPQISREEIRRVLAD
jgi:hypothetical protein